jgi:hypothetical protein
MFSNIKDAWDNEPMKEITNKLERDLTSESESIKKLISSLNTSDIPSLATLTDKSVDNSRLLKSCKNIDKLVEEKVQRKLENILMEKKIQELEKMRGISWRDIIIIVSIVIIIILLILLIIRVSR